MTNPRQPNQPTKPLAELQQADELWVHLDDALTELEAQLAFLADVLPDRLAQDSLTDRSAHGLLLILSATVQQVAKVRKQFC